MSDELQSSRPRRKPAQKRSAWTVDAILQAAAEILERDGEAALTTGKVAKRAGVSIGTLYQYFGHRDAILVALAEREIECLIRRTDELMSRPRPGNRARILIRVLIDSYRRRSGARRQAALIMTLRSKKSDPTLKARYADLHAKAWEGGNPSPDSTRSKVYAYAMTSAIIGVLQSAAWDDSPILKDPNLEEALFEIFLALRRPNRSDASRLELQEDTAVS